MGREFMKRLNAARLLHEETRKVGNNGCCVPVTLTAMGVKDFHFVEVDRRSELDQNISFSVGSELAWAGCFVPALLNLAYPVTERDLKAMLENPNHFLHEAGLDGNVGPCMGYLVAKKDHDADCGHVFAIHPRRLAPRDIRRYMKERDLYMVTDTLHPKTTIACRFDDIYAWLKKHNERAAVEIGPVYRLP